MPTGRYFSHVPKKKIHTSLCCYKFGDKYVFLHDITLSPRKKMHFAFTITDLQQMSKEISVYIKKFQKIPKNLKIPDKLFLTSISLMVDSNGGLCCICNIF